MGEYAIRKSDKQEIKIGTCEDMYYLRFEDRSKVSPRRGNVNPADDKDASELRFRLPFPDEDEVLPGEYDKYNRGLRLYRMVKSETTAPDYCEDFKDESTADHPGIIQLRHDSGLLINVPCYHGIKLPKAGTGMQVFWNGKSHSLELGSLRGILDSNGKLAIVPVVKCRHCGSAWRYDWSDVWDYIPTDMQTRLRPYKDSISQPSVQG